MSVLLENIPLVKLAIKTTSRTQVVNIFHNLTREFIDDIILVILVDDHEVLPSVEVKDVSASPSPPPVFLIIFSHG